MDETDFEIEVEGITAPEWNESLDRFEDANLYQTWSYGAVRWGQRNVSHLILKQRGTPVALAQLRIVRPLRLRMGMAHLRWGPVCQTAGSQLNVEILQRMANALYDEYVIRQGLFLRVLPNAIVGTTRAEAFQTAFAQYANQPFAPAESYRTFDVNLEPPLEIIRSKLHQKWRNQLNSAERNNLTVTEPDDQVGFEKFQLLYDQMSARKQLEASSDIQEFKRVQAQLPARQRMKVFICEHAGDPVAGLVGTAIGNTAVYLLGATNEQGMKSKGAYLLQWRMIKWLKENGIKHYDLGGINPEINPGVHHFKAGLSGNDVLYLNPRIGCESVASQALAKSIGPAGSKIRKLLGGMLRARAG